MLCSSILADLLILEIAYLRRVWRKTTPKDLKMKKSLKKLMEHDHDNSYVGEDAWDDDRDTPEENVRQMIENDERLDKGKKKELRKGLGASGSAVTLLTDDMETSKYWLKTKY
ncbi:hypothetical protein K1719_014955 [Acacia pycnantha]|nr:hypothetical protein K1719_014955 [Acacia pycnantha]